LALSIILDNVAPFLKEIVMQEEIALAKKQLEATKLREKLNSLN
jgi:hypothetical protein